MGNAIGDTTSLLEAAVFGCPLDVDIAPIDTQTVDTANFGLDPNVPPGQNFDLLTWSIDTPERDPEDGLALRTSERDLGSGYESTGHFFTNTEDVWMYFRVGAYTQKGSGDRGDDSGLGSDFDQITFFKLSNTHGEQ